MNGRCVAKLIEYTAGEKKNRSKKKINVRKHRGTARGGAKAHRTVGHLPPATKLSRKQPLIPVLKSNALAVLRRSYLDLYKAHKTMKIGTKPPRVVWGYQWHLQRIAKGTTARLGCQKSRFPSQNAMSLNPMVHVNGCVRPEYLSCKVEATSDTSQELPLKYQENNKGAIVATSLSRRAFTYWLRNDFDRELKYPQTSCLIIRRNL